MASISITLKGETYQLDISDDRAVNILSSLGVLKDNKQFEVFGAPDYKIKNSCCNELKQRKEIDKQISENLKSLIDIITVIKTSVDKLNETEDKLNETEDKLNETEGNNLNTNKEDETEILKDVDAVIEQSKAITIKKYRNKPSIYRAKIEEYGWDKFVDEYSHCEKSAAEFAELFGVKKQSLLQFLSSNGIKKIPELRSRKQNIKEDIPKQTDENKIMTLRDKVNEYGLQKLEEEYSSGLRNADYFAKLFDVTKQNMLNFLSKNGIHKNKKAISEELDKKLGLKSKNIKKQSNKENNIKKPALSQFGTILLEEDKKRETCIKVENGICLKCGYRDRIIGTCGYTMLTSKNRQGKKGECDHFVNVEDIL